MLRSVKKLYLRVGARILSWWAFVVMSVMSDAFAYVCVSLFAIAAQLDMHRIACVLHALSYG